MKVIYVAGPFRGETPWQVEENIRIAERTGLRVAKAGHIPLIPHTMYRFFDGSASDEFWLEGTQELLRRCDGIVMSVGWERSSGSKAELDLAMRGQKAGSLAFMSIEAFEGWAEAMAPGQSPRLSQACTDPGKMHGASDEFGGTDDAGGGMHAPSVATLRREFGGDDG
jgi:hypothetical protein